MSQHTLHENIIVFDGLCVSNWSREVFEAMRQGGVTAANCTCCVWEDFDGTMANIDRWKEWFQEYGDLILQVHSTRDIQRAKRDGQTGIILGFQNVSALGEDLGRVELFKELGVGIAQMAYNTRNPVGDGCYESEDGGLSDFGLDVVKEMNRVGMMCDLSHVGAKTSEDVILASERPVCYSHCLPNRLKEHPRNKSDGQLKFIADNDGFVGVTMFPPFLQKGSEATVDDYVEAIDYVIDLVGEDRVGIGTDFTQGYGPDFFEWITHDKGTGRKLIDLGEIVYPEGMREIADFPNLTAAMGRAGWSEAKIRKVMGENWVSVLGTVWGNGD